MAGGFDDLSRNNLRKNVAHVEAPARVSQKPIGAPRRGKAAIKSRTMSFEDEYMDLINLVIKSVPDLNLSRSDVLRVAIAHLADNSADKLALLLEQNRAISCEEIEHRTKELERQFHARERKRVLDSITPDELARLVDKI